MRVVTLTTDWGLKDYYVPSLKAQIISLVPSANIVDICHLINHFDILQASYVISNCYNKFPEGTVHMVCVRRTTRKDKSIGYVLVKCNGHFFLGFDSGVFSLILGDQPKEVFKLDIDTSVPQYLGSEHLCKVASDILNGVDYKSIGTPIDDVMQILNTQPAIEQTGIRGAIIHIDSFSNVVTNITRDDFEKVVRGRPFAISIRGEHHEFKRINNHYDEVMETELAAMFNEKGNLFVSINKGRAASLLGLKVFDTIRLDVI